MVMLTSPVMTASFMTVIQSSSGTLVKSETISRELRIAFLALKFFAFKVSTKEKLSIMV